ncbi:asparagine synthetase B (glutamine-hydrolyzing) [Bacillus pakistanensis]|uniref:Asparagine synthetase B (Glutamine-hydrolyzing) n=1 Tax=Rossellomorea pakistanensis TaxID=992288 RepID=A0ABS2NDH1_9BACI|nr:asparagine synthetase B (glutamine-hydrolyzing) [Bacillus pakistanensis]
MTRIPEHDREMIETAMYLPMVLKILERDMEIFQKGQYKLRRPYLELIEEAMKSVQRDLKMAKEHLRKESISIAEVKEILNLPNTAFIIKGMKNSIITLIHGYETNVKIY